MSRPHLVLPLLALTLFACGDKDDGETAQIPGGEDTGPDLPPCNVNIDFDCDGFVEDDCEPNNATAYPGATELPYDGVDNDCAGDGDWTDVDGDGFDSDVVGGEDCNDSNPEINPDAEETCYDNIDYDCDGFPTDDEPEGEDCDGDGFDRGEDCNDEDPEVNPDADEIWYDGVDQNCRGTIESDYDQDGDGEDSAEHLDGGTDCDDLVPTTGLMQPELLDGVDNNCDTVVDQVPMRDASASYTGNAATGEGLFGTAVIPMDDYDGDGNREVAFGSPLADDNTSACDKVVSSPDYNVAPCGGWLTVMPMDGTDGRPSAAAYARVVGDGAGATGQGDWLGFAAANLGDLNGDAYAEIAVGAIERNNGTILIYDGASFVGGGDLTTGDALTDIRDAGIGAFVGALGDVDGDGRDELIGGGPGGAVAPYMLGATTLNLAVWSGADAGGGGTLLGSSAIATLDDDSDGGSALGRADFNGDGTADIVVATDLDADGAVMLWDGTDIAMGGAFTAGDYASITGPSASSTGLGFGTTLGWLDDVDGDGYAEVAVAAPLDEGDQEGSGVIYVLDGDSLTTAGSAASKAIATINGVEYYGVAQVVGGDTAGDVDGDGKSDLMVADVGGTAFNAITGQVFIYSGVDIAAGGALTSADADAQIPSRTPNDLFGFAGAWWDMDGDGDSDIALSAPQAGEAGFGAIFPSSWAD